MAAGEDGVIILEIMVMIVEVISKVVIIIALMKATDSASVNLINATVNCEVSISTPSKSDTSL